MSLHLNQQCQRAANLPFYRQNQADNVRTPLFNSGDLLSVYVGDRGGGPFEAAFPSGERASKAGL